MTGQRVAILDASRALTSRDRNHPSSHIDSQPKTPILPSKLTSSPSKAGTQEEKRRDEKGKNTISPADGVLQPIPRFPDLIREAVQEALNSDPAIAAENVLNATGPSQTPQSMRRHRVAQIDIGVICDVDFVDRLAPRLHSRILRALISV